MSKIIAIALQKGGTGKTTTVINTATILGKHNKKVLVLDLDPQGNATSSSGFSPYDQTTTILHVLLGKSPIQKSILHSEYGYDIIPSNVLLSSLVVSIITNPQHFPEPMLLLKNVLAEVKDKYDFVLIDLPPELGFLTINGLSACDEVLIPLQCEARAIDGVNDLLDSIEQTRDYYNPDIKIMGILGTMFSRNTNLSTTVLQQARKHFDNKIRVYDTVIYRTVKFSEADLYNKPAILYSENEQIQAYNAFVKEAFSVG